MLDQLRHDLQARLDDLLGEADKLRRALGALGSHNSSTASTTTAAPSPSAGRTRARTSARPAAAPQPGARKPARPRPTATAPAAEPVKPPASKPAADTTASTARRAPGAAKSAVLAALAAGNAMTAGEIATATGVGRATVSTTLSRLANAGELTKVDRGYQIASQTDDAAARAAVSDAAATQPAGRVWAIG
jgi:DNA-binding transcriptional ArsR family regulator